MTFNIEEFRSRLVGGGARPSLFQIQWTNPVNGGADFKVPFMAKATSIPGSTLGTVQTPYFGRQINYDGDRTFDTWQITVVNDEDYAIHASLSRWMDRINGHESNRRAYPSEYKSTGIVTQYGRKETALHTFIMEGAFPTQLDAIALDWGTTDTIEEFGVTFTFDYWRYEGIAGSVTT